jgi:hypothetical protein
MNTEHLSDHNLERYHLGMIQDEAELARLEAHLLWCRFCVDWAREPQITCIWPAERRFGSITRSSIGETIRQHASRTPNHKLTNTARKSTPRDNISPMTRQEKEALIVSATRVFTAWQEIMEVQQHARDSALKLMDDAERQRGKIEANYDLS